MKERRIIEVEEKLPILQTLPLSLQHLFAMFGATVLVPFLLNVDPSTALFMNGVGTLLYLSICKWRLPSYLGSSFAFISPVLAVTHTAGLTYGDAQGGFIAFGLCFILVGLLVKKIGTKWIDVLFPPAAMGAIVAIIGLELAPMAMNMAGFMDPVKGMTNIQAMEISSATLIITILATLLGKGFIGIIPILIGVVSGYAIAYGHLFVTSDIVGRDLIKDPGLHRSLIADGLSNVLSGLAGSTPNTTYGENMGVMAITGVYSTWVIGGAAILAIVFSFVGKIAALIHNIPGPVMGGVSILLFGFIASSGLRMMVDRKVDFTKPKNLILSALTLISGLSGATIVIGPVQLKGMGLATVVAILASLAFLIFEKIGWVERE